MMRRIVRVLVGLAMLAGAWAQHGWAGEPTKNEPRQPGAQGAIVIEAKDHPSLQAAIDALPAGGGCVRIAAGRFELAEPLVLTKGDVMLQGVGTATHIVNTNEAGQPALRIEPPQGVESLWRIQICDLRITGNPKSGPGLHIKKVDELLVSRVSVEHNGSDGLLLEECYEDPRIADCLVTYNKGTGINVLRSHDIIISATQLEENIDAVHCIDGYNLTMTGCDVDDHLGCGVVIRNTYGSIISANMIEECNGAQIVLEGECYGDAITANTIADGQDEGVRLIGVRDITISANTFVLMVQPAIHALDGARQLTITGNTFNKYPFDPTKRHRQMPGQGIALDAVRDVTISGNTFTLLRREAIRVAGEANSRLNITGNTILNPCQEAPGTYSAVSLANLTSSIVSNNLITDDQPTRTTKALIEFSGACTRNAVIGNILTPAEPLAVPGELNQVLANIAQ